MLPMLLSRQRFPFRDRQPERLLPATLGRRAATIHAVTMRTDGRTRRTPEVRSSAQPGEWDHGVHRDEECAVGRDDDGLMAETGLV